MCKYCPLSSNFQFGTHRQRYSIGLCPWKTYIPVYKVDIEDRRIKKQTQAKERANQLEDEDLSSKFIGEGPFK